MLNSHDAVERAVNEIIGVVVDKPALRMAADGLLSDIEGLDSVKLVEVILALEDRYGIRMSAADMDNIRTAGSLVAIVKARAG